MSRKVFKYLKLCAIVLVVCAVITMYPSIPHELARGIVYVAQGVTHTMSYLVSHATAYAHK